MSYQAICIAIVLMQQTGCVIKIHKAAASQQLHKTDQVCVRLKNKKSTLDFSLVIGVHKTFLHLDGSFLSAAL